MIKFKKKASLVQSTVSRIPVAGANSVPSAISAKDSQSRIVPDSAATNSTTKPTSISTSMPLPRLNPVVHVHRVANARKKGKTDASGDDPHASTNTGHFR
ncbi:unnamed protein product, partial [Amoebophrya sp. A25]|eukprot:GSA25T00004016001.1